MPSPQPWGSATGRPDTSVSMAIDATTTAAARQQIRSMLAGRADLLVADAVQVTDELVSNAVRHGEPPRRLRVILSHGGRRLRMEVEDASPLEPMPRMPDRTGGLGIVLVHRLATAWGVQRHDRRKTVWAEMDLTRYASSGQPAHLSAVPAVRSDARRR
jgi:two-component sensor histidine kinase